MRAVYGGQYIHRPAHQTYTRMHIKRRIQHLFLRRIPPSQRRISIHAHMHITITLSLQFMWCTVSILPTPLPPLPPLPPQLYAHAYNHRSERIRTCLLSYNYTPLLPSKSITSFTFTYITSKRDAYPYEALTSQAHFGFTHSQYICCF